MNSEVLDSMLKVLKANGVQSFRSKKEEDYIEIVFKDTIVEIEDEEPVTNPVGFKSNNIGLKFEPLNRPSRAEDRL